LVSGPPFFVGVYLNHRQGAEYSAGWRLRSVNSSSTSKI
jgi:hypothetical protein